MRRELQSFIFISLPRAKSLRKKLGRCTLSFKTSPGMALKLSEMLEVILSKNFDYIALGETVSWQRVACCYSAFFISKHEVISISEF